MELQASTDCSLTSASLSSIPTQQRVSLPLATLILHLKNSLTSPISREEAEKCIQLLVDEVAPDWINTVTLGEVTAIIINKKARAGVSGWKDRVEM
jgi:DNA replication factor Cdt1 C-terminal domain